MPTNLLANLLREESVTDQLLPLKERVGNALSRNVDRVIPSETEMAEGQNALRSGKNWLNTPVGQKVLNWALLGPMAGKSIGNLETLPSRRLEELYEQLRSALVSGKIDWDTYTSRAEPIIAAKIRAHKREGTGPYAPPSKE